MKAIVQDRYGSPDVLQLREVDDPAPGQSEVRVRIAAASVNAADWHVLRGDPKAGPSGRPPHLRTDRAEATDPRSRLRRSSRRGRRRRDPLDAG